MRKSALSPVQRPCTDTVHIYSLGSTLASDPPSAYSSTFRARRLFSGRFQRGSGGRRAVTESYGLTKQRKVTHWAFAPPDSGRTAVLVSTSKPGPATAPGTGAAAVKGSDASRCPSLPDVRGLENLSQYVFNRS